MDERSIGIERQEETVEVDVELVYKTEEAVLVSEGQVEGWIPKSLIAKPNREDVDEMDLGTWFKIEIPEWKAIEVEFV